MSQNQKVLSIRFSSRNQVFLYWIASQDDENLHDETAVPTGGSLLRDAPLLHEACQLGAQSLEWSEEAGRDIVVVPESGPLHNFRKTGAKSIGINVGDGVACKTGWSQAWDNWEKLLVYLQVNIGF